MNHLRSAFFLTFIAQLCSLGYSNAAAQILYAALFILWTVAVYREKELKYHSFDLLFAAFVLFRIVTILLSEYPEASNGTFFREVIFYPYYFIAKYFLSAYGMDGVRKALTALIVSMTVPSLYAVVTVVSGMAERGSSFTGGYMVFAVNAGFVFAFALAMFVSEEKKNLRLLFGLSAAVILLGVISTYSRAVWISVIGCFVLAGYIGYRRSAAAALLGLSVSVIAIPAIRERLQSLMNPFQNSSGRMELWNAAVQLLPHHPFVGFGPETFNSIIGDRSVLPDQFVASWHNEFLQIQIESGMIGLFLLLTLYGAAGWMIVSMRHYAADKEKKFIYLFGLFSVIIIIPSVLTGSVMFSVMNGMFLKFTLAVIVWYSGSIGIIAAKVIKVRS